jgi:glycosyltransferase involved in cell wall biosynthesis
MKVELLVSCYKRMIGLARYTTSIQKYLPKCGVNPILVEPSYPVYLQVAHSIFRYFRYDIKEFFNTYVASAELSDDAVKHFTTQMMGSLFIFQRHLKSVVITVHDIVPYMTRRDPEQNVYMHFYDRWMDHLAMRNLRKADYLIAISEFTKKMLIEKLGCDDSKIQVILYGLDHELFRPLQVTQEFRSRYQLDPEIKYLVYVGSENPRKNLKTLVYALQKIKTNFPNIRLLKIGTPEYLINYQLLQKQIYDLGLENHIKFIDHPTQEDLIRFYSIADIFVFPSLFEGFGMPPLEAMACGAPVVCSNATSLPEVVGDAAITVNPLDITGWADAICEVLDNHTLQRELREKSLARAGQFTWEKHAELTKNVYERVGCKL